MSKVAPFRGQIWTANIGEPPSQHWVVIVSSDTRNQQPNIDTILVVPFSRKLRKGPTTAILEPAETGLPHTSCLRAHFIQPLSKSRLREMHPRGVSEERMADLCLRIRRSFDPDAPADDVQI
jgi:mRNA-degrading endonuclease toxin of MazEF toxin-antitoxin module